MGDATTNTDATTGTSVEIIGGRDQGTVLEILLGALAEDPLAIWMLPDRPTRRQLQEHLHRGVLARPGAGADLTVPHGGAAIWLNMDGTPSAASADGTSSDTSSDDGPAARIEAVGRALAPFHPEEPHLYLWCMGVGATQRGRGLGSSMLLHRTARADLDRTPLYLEASSARSRALYLRHGFADLAEPVRVAGSPPIWPMARRPR